MPVQLIVSIVRNPSQAVLQSAVVRPLAQAISLCFSQIITPFHIYFNTYFIFQKLELWRLLTNFLYFGSLSESPIPCPNSP